MCLTLLHMSLPIETVSYPKDGLFSVVNRVLGRCLHNAVHGRLTRVDWRNSCYADSEINAWDIILEQPYSIGKLEVTLTERAKSVSPERIIGPRVICSEWGSNFCDSLMLPPVLPDATHCTAFFRPLPQIASHVALLSSKLNIEDCVGVHMRGPGRNHGGVRHMNRHFALINGMPFPAFTRLIDAMPASIRLFVCSDAFQAVELFKQRYGRRVITTESPLLREGEAHEAGEYRRIGDRLIKDALTDALLLSKCRHLLHGNSNVTNFIQAYRPSLPHSDIYQDFYRSGLPYATKRTTYYYPE